MNEIEEKELTALRNEMEQKNIVCESSKLKIREMLENNGEQIRAELIEYNKPKKLSFFDKLKIFFKR